MYTAHNFPATHVHDCTATHVFAAALVYRTCFLLVKQFWLIRAVVIWPVIHFWTNCEIAQNLFKNRLIQGLTWFNQSSLFCHLLDMRQAVGIFVSSRFFELSQFKQLNISRLSFFLSIICQLWRCHIVHIFSLFNKCIKTDTEPIPTNVST